MKEKKPKKKRSIIKTILKAIFFGILAFVTILAAFFVIAKYYYSFYPPLGNDYYHSFNLINYFKNNLTWPQDSWRYIWHYGGPTIITYPWLNFYLVQPVIKFFGLYQGSVYYFLGTIFLYGFAAYFLFYRLSKSYFVSIGLAVSLIWSASTWRLISAGSLTLTVNQFFLVLALLFIFIYLQNKKRKYLFLSSLVAGLSVISQSGSGFPFIIPVNILIILGWWGGKERFWQASKIKDLGFYLVISLLVSLYTVYYTIVNILSSRGGFEQFDWMRLEAFSSIINKTDPLILVLFGICLLVVIFYKRLKVAIRKIFPILFAFLYLILFNLATINGLNPFSSSLPPPENWYISTLLIALGVAILWGEVTAIFSKCIKNWLIGFMAVAAFLILLAPFGYWQSKDMLKSFEKSNIVCGAPSEAIHQAMVKGNFSELDQVLPNWFKKDDINWRLYSSCMDIWWNTLYKMPLTGGYDQLLTNKINRNYINWTNEIFNGTLVQKGLSAEIIKNSMLFHIDWLGIRYLERLGGFSYLADPEIIKLDNKPESDQVFEVNEKIKSPIVRPTKAPTMLVVSGQEGYDTVLRILAQENLNSRYIIPIQGPEYIEDLKNYDLTGFDAVFLYDYRYRKEKNFKSYPVKPWQKLYEYVNNGGSLFIETGSEVKESDIKNLPMVNLPEVFPINKTTRNELGEAWDYTINQANFFKDVKIENFDKLVYQGSPWKISYTEGDALKNWAKSVLTQNGEQVLVSGELGQGKVIWSGLNLLYHIKSYNNLAESKLFRNLLGYLVNLNEEQPLVFNFQRAKSENILIEANDFKGVLFKESYYPGWQVKQGDEELKIYKAGFNFMYIPVKNSAEVSIKYLGDIKYKIMFYISIAVILLIMLYLILGRKLTLGFKKIIKIDKIRKITKSWWEKDEEEK